MDSALAFVIFLVLLALVFDFINGFHDAANSIATIVSTGVLSPYWAVMWAAFFNFIAFLVFKLSVANTIGTGIITPDIVDSYLIFAALMGAIIWNLVTWFFGMPSSSSHALIGGLVGAALMKGGVDVIVMSGFNKVLLAIVLSPIIGVLIGLLFMKIAAKLARNVQNKDRLFGHLQFVSAAFLSLTHGGNDAQKTMGIIAVLLYSANLLGKQFYVPFWVVISCNLVMALGTMAGGWRIVNTMGKKITHLNTMRGCCAESGAAITLFVATVMGIPVSTTHTVTGAIAGVGLSGGYLSTRWSIIRSIVFVWLITLPCSGLIAAGLIYIKRYY